LFRKALIGSPRQKPPPEYQPTESCKDRTALYKTLRLGDAQYNRLVKLDAPLGVDGLLPLYVKGTARLGCGINRSINGLP